MNSETSRTTDSIYGAVKAFPRIDIVLNNTI